MRSGRIDLASSTGTLRSNGASGHYWSSREADNVWSSVGAGGYDLLFGATEVHPSWGPDYQWLGFSLRCLSTVLDM